MAHATKYNHGSETSLLIFDTFPRRCCCPSANAKSRIGGRINPGGQADGAEGAGCEAGRGVGTAGEEAADNAHWPAHDLVVAVIEDPVDGIEAGGDQRGLNPAADAEGANGTRGKGVVAAARKSI